MSEIELACGTCLCWKKAKNSDTLGECRRFPPQVYGTAGTRFPEVTYKSHCFEWRSKTGDLLTTADIQPG